MSKPGYEDANLILELYKLRREETMRKARSWIAQEFKPQTVEEMNALCPPGSTENAYVRMVYSYWEMVASFITQGVLSEELFFASGGEMILAWTRIEPLLEALRKETNNPQFLEGMEETARRFAAWMDGRQPGSFAKLQTRFREM